MHPTNQAPHRSSGVGHPGRMSREYTFTPNASIRSRITDSPPISDTTTESNSSPSKISNSSLRWVHFEKEKAAPQKQFTAYVVPIGEADLASPVNRVEGTA